MNDYPTNGRIPTRRYHVFPNPSDRESASAGKEPEEQRSPTPMPRPATPSGPPQSHLQHGLTLYAQGNTLGALSAFSQGVKREPEDPLGHYLCGLAFQALGHGQEAQNEWEAVLTLTANTTSSGEEAPARAGTQWVRGLVQRLLARGSAGGEENPPAREMPPMDDVPLIGVEGAGMWNQGELETAILEAVQRHGGCYVQDRSLASILGVTTEEQVVGWEQSFSVREGLSCHPHCQSSRQESHPWEIHSDGVVFQRRDAP